MITKEKQEQIEDIILKDSLPILVSFGEEDDLKFSNNPDFKPDLILRTVFPMGKDTEIFTSLNKHKKEILEVLDNKNFYIRPVTFHYYLTSEILPKAYSEADMCYFSPITESKKIEVVGGTPQFQIELKLLLITRGYISNPQPYFEKVKSLIDEFNQTSRHIKITKLSVASKNDPFQLAGEPEPTFTQLPLA